MPKNKFRSLSIALAALILALPIAVGAQTETVCTIRATRDIHVEVHDFSKDRKGQTTWSGNISKGGQQTVRASGGEILIEWQDLSQDNPRTQNRNDICDGNTILVP